MVELSDAEAELAADAVRWTAVSLRASIEENSADPQSKAATKALARVETLMNKLTANCPKCGCSGLVPRVEPNEWSVLTWYACDCPAGDQHRELVQTDFS